MKKLLLISAVILTAACAKELPCAEYDTIGAALEGASTRTALQGLDVVWSDGDAISVFSHDIVTRRDKFTIESGGAKNGSFKGRLSVSPDNRYYALYPSCDDLSFDGRTLVFSLPATQEYVAGGFAPGANPSVAAFSYETKDQVAFKNACGLLELQLKGPAGTCVSQISVEDAGGRLLSGAASVDAEGIVSGNPVLDVTDGAPMVTLNVPDVALNPDTPVSFFIVVPAGAFEGGFKAEIIDGSSFKRFRIVAPAGNTIARSMVREMPAAVLDNPEETIDLSENGTSNCYLVNDPVAGSFKFFAGAKGNAGLSASGSDSIKPVSAGLLWATAGTTVPPAADGIVANVQLRDGYVHFDTRGVKGNAVIAARDASGSILWSWHIWVVPGMDISGVSAANVRGPLMDGHYWIDRNLGALGNTEDDLTSAGLLYQWGRKDPFTATNDYTSSAAEYTDEQRVAGEEWSLSTTAATVAESVLHPTTFYVANNWLKTNDNSLWGEKKTIYDPCPVGYKVVPYTDFKQLSLEKKTYGFELSYNGVDAGWLPMVGRRNKNTGTMEYVTQYSHLWAARSTDSGVGRYYINYPNANIKCDETQTAIRAMGNSVRCCRE